MRCTKPVRTAWSKGHPLSERDWAASKLGPWSIPWKNPGSSTGLDGEYLEPFCKAESEIGFRLSPLLPWVPSPTPAPAPTPAPTSAPAPTPAPAPSPRRSPPSSLRFERRNPASSFQRLEPAEHLAYFCTSAPSGLKPLSGCDWALSGGERTPPWDRSASFRR